jgi:hypothetical protein
MRPTPWSPILLCLLLLPAAPARAQTPTREAAALASTGRCLAGHCFLLSEFVPPPFVVTQFGLQSGLGIASATAPKLDSQGAVTGTTDYDLGALEQIASLRLAPSPYFGLRLSVAGSAVVGTDVNSALVLGAFFGYDLAAGAIGSIAFGRVRLSASFDLGLDRFYSFNVANAIVQSVNAGKIDASTLLTDSTTKWLSPGVQAAVAFHRAVGGWVDVAYRHDFTSAGDQSDDDGRMELGAALSVDLHPVTPAPIGMLGTYHIILPFAKDSSATHEVTAGVFYTGRHDLLVGVEGRITLSSPATDVDFTTYEGIVGLRYYWN